MSKPVQARSLSSQQLSRFYQLACACLLLWLLAWLLIPWNSLQDTALTYLRVATDLDANRTIWNGGADWSSGRLSLLYLPLLMLAHGFFDYAVLLRVVSSIGYLLLLTRLVLGMATRVRRAGPLTLALAILLLAALCTPAAVFWLNDGAETSFTLFLVATLLFNSRRVLRHGTSSSWTLGVWCCLAVFARAEIFFATLLLTAIFSVWGQDGAALTGGRGHRTSSSAPWKTPLLASLVALVALTLTRLVLQIGLPLRVSVHPDSWRWALLSSWDSLLEARSFGWGLLLLWLLSLVLVRAVDHRRRSTLLANTLPLLVLLALTLRGEVIAFASELSWPLLFAALWNLLEIAAAERDRVFRPETLLLGLRSTIAVVLLLLVAVRWDAPLVLHAMKARRDKLRFFESQPLSLLVRLHGVATEPGYTGYFTLSPTCNPGRTEGARIAPDDYAGRLHACAESHPDYAFLDLQQVNDLARHMDLTSWFVCQSFDVDRLTGHDQHYLVASPAATQRVCLATHGLAVPLAPLLSTSQSARTP